LVFDVSDDTNPQLLGESLPTDNSFYVTLENNHIFVLDEEGGLNILKATDSAKMKLISHLELPIGGVKLSIEDDLMLIACQPYGLKVVSVADIDNPVVVASIDTLVFTMSVQIKNKIGYVVGINGLYVVDLSRQDKPSVIGSCDLDGWPSDIILNNNLAYVLGPSIQVVDISVPTNPKVITTTPKPLWAQSLIKSENILYASGRNSVYKFDISNPKMPVQIGQYTSSDIYGVDVADNYLLLARLNSGVIILNISDFSNPYKVAEFETPVWAFDVKVDKEYIYIADLASLIRFRYSYSVGFSENTAQYITPSNFKLHQNYPNPFNSTTNIEFSLPGRSNVQINVFNILGQKVKTIINQEKSVGRYSIQWDGTNSYGSAVASGIYFYQIKTDDYSEARKMILLK
jgi:hypothetical protein